MLGNYGAKFNIPVQNSMSSYTITVTTDIPLTKFQVEIINSIIRMPLASINLEKGKI